MVGGYSERMQVQFGAGKGQVRLVLHFTDYRTRSDTVFKTNRTEVFRILKAGVSSSYLISLEYYHLTG